MLYKVILPQTVGKNAYYFHVLYLKKLYENKYVVDSPMLMNSSMMGKTMVFSTKSNKLNKYVPFLHLQKPNLS